MSIANNLWEELKQEAANTRKLLELVPFEKADFKPHEKSMTLKKTGMPCSRDHRLVERVPDHG